MLEGKPVTIGSILSYEEDGKIKKGKVTNIYITSTGMKFVTLNDSSVWIALDACVWPDPESPKRWAYVSHS